MEADAGRRVLDGILAAAREKGLLRSAGRARTDSTHVLSAARELSWLEMVAGTLRSALNTLAQAAPGWLVEVAEPDWFQHFHVVEGEVRRRDPKDRPPRATRLVTPYDTGARGSVERDTMWDGYKVHLTETCEADVPNLVTTPATVPDSVMSEEIHTSLAARDCLPGEHWVDAG